MIASTAFNMRVAAGEVTVNVPAMDNLLAEIRNCFLNGRGFALATVNLDHMVKFSRRKAFRDAYGAHDYVVADGNPIVWLSRLARRPVSLVPGADLVTPLVRLAAESGAPVALVGSTAKVVAGAAVELSGKAPGLRIATMIAPSEDFDPSGDEGRRLLDQLAASDARLTLIALGAPKQEVFAALGRSALPQMGFASLGASLDFLAGAQTRAPRWVRGLALEWLWRVAGNPRRFATRYLQCAMILPGLFADALAARRQNAETPGEGGP